MANRSQFSENYFKGAQQAEQEHAAELKRQHDAEDRKHQETLLKFQIAQLKRESELQDRKAALENIGLVDKQQPGQEVSFPAQGESAVGALPGQTKPLIPEHAAAMPLPSQTVPGLSPSELSAGVPSAQYQPQSLQEHLQQLRQQKMFESALKQQENQREIPAVPGLGIDQPITGDKEILTGLISQLGQNQRQSGQQTFTASENEKRLKAASETAAADRTSRENIANANRLQRAAQAAQSGKQSKQVQQAMTLSNRFDTNPITKQYGILNESLQFVNSLDPKTTNPADDQGLIYAFAKAMDPNSVVREGEYATVQKYIQSWAEKFGFDAKRLYSNTAFLTPAARENLKATILTKAQASEKQYQNLKNEFGKKFQNIGEDPTGWLTDLGGTTQGPKAGEVQDGYVFLGGDPSNPNSWKKQ